MTSTRPPFGPLGVMRSWLRLGNGGGGSRPRGGLGTRLFSWIVFIVAALFFLLPLYATVVFSLRLKDEKAYTNVLFHDPGFASSLVYSLVVGVITIVMSIA